MYLKGSVAGQHLLQEHNSKLHPELGRLLVPRVSGDDTDAASKNQSPELKKLPSRIVSCLMTVYLEANPQALTVQQLSSNDSNDHAVFVKNQTDKIYKPAANTYHLEAEFDLEPPISARHPATQLVVRATYNTDKDSDEVQSRVTRLDWPVGLFIRLISQLQEGSFTTEHSLARIVKPDAELPDVISHDDYGFIQESWQKSNPALVSLAVESIKEVAAMEGLDLLAS